MADWKEVEGSLTNNTVLRGEGFFISYAPKALPGLFASDGSGAETAIVTEDGFFILNGDHRRSYESLVPKGLDVCMTYFDDHQDQESSWSD